MNLPAFVHHSPTQQVTSHTAPFDYGRALSLREMAKHYTEIPKYLLAPEVAGCCITYPTGTSMPLLIRCGTPAYASTKRWDSEEGTFTSMLRSRM